MTWNVLPTLLNNAAPTHTDLNKYRENIEHLHALPYSSYVYTSETNITTVATTWASINANFELNLTTSGGYVLVLLRVVFTLIELDIEVDGTRLGSTPATTGNGLARNTNTLAIPISLPIILDLAAGAHTFKAMMKATSGTGTIYGAYQPAFDVQEL